MWVCARQDLETGRPFGDRKSPGAQKQTNKGQAAVIKSSLVLVTHKNAAERQKPAVISDPTVARAWHRPLLCATTYPETSSLSTSAGMYRVVSVLDTFFFLLVKRGSEEGHSANCYRASIGSSVSGYAVLSKSGVKHVTCALMLEESGRVVFKK